MTADASYPELLRVETERALRRPVPSGEGDPSATVELVEQDGEPTLVLHAVGCSLTVGVWEGVYHYEPDGQRVEVHADWLAQAFNEDAEPDEPRPPYPPVTAVGSGYTVSSAPPPEG